MEEKTIHIAGPSYIGIRMEAKPVSDLTSEQFKKLWSELNNPTFYINEDGIVAVEQVERVCYDHSEAATGELVWACDRCGAYSRSRRVVEEHEKTCEG